MGSIPLLLGLAGVLLALSPTAVEAGDPIAWGNNNFGQRNVPPGAQSGVIAVAAGYLHSLALTGAGEVIAWGYNDYGICDVPPGAQSGVTAIAGGQHHSLALTEAGEVIAWGREDQGQCNVPAEAQSGVIAIAAGGYHNLALKGGQVIAWGDNYFGQRTVPAEAQSGVIAIAGGGNHSLALKDGQVIAWGQNLEGQLNVPPEAQSGVIAIAGGAQHSLALTGAGEVIAWGLNNYGQCNVPPAAQSGVIAISAGHWHDLALTGAGQLIAWGHNLMGQCNVPPGAQSGVIAIVGGGYHSLALLPLQADFSGSPTSGTAPLTVDFTDLSTSSPTAWQWDFGDGGADTAQDPSHEYTSPGLYTVSLMATNAQGSDTETKADYITVTVAPPVAEFSGLPSMGWAPLMVYFTDLSTNDPTSWNWDFGDTGTSSLQNPSHEYASPSVYTVSLTATNAEGSNTETKPNYITVTVVPPVADFVGNPTSGTVPLTVNFTDQSTNDPASWDWDFGDGGTSLLQNPSHEYTSTGQFTVSLSAANAGGSDTETKTDYITVAVPPVADFVGNPASGTVPLTVNFTDQSTNDPTSWDWDFGDTGTSSVQNPSHEYTSTGQFTVSLTAANAGGQDTETKPNYITVTVPPPVGDPIAWGYNSYGQCTVPPAAQSGVIAIAAGYQHSLAVTDTGEVIGWGWNDWGQCTVPPAAQTGVIAIAAGWQHSLALTEGGQVIAWGRNDYGQCTVPAAAQSGVIAIARGAWHSLALKDGEVIAWGLDYYGQCTVPAEAQSGVTAIAGGGTHSLALTGAGEVIAWGDNGRGQCTVPPEAQSGGIAVAGGAEHSLALKDGQVIAWGLNDYGQCTVPPAAQSGVTAIAAAGWHNLALRGAGQVIAWGKNLEGQCNVPPAAQSGVIAIVGGGYHSLALLPLQADFSGLPTSGIVPLTVNFTDLSTNDPTSWDWDFGDSGTSSLQHPSHEYTSLGLYTVSLTATNAEGSNTVTKPNYITVAVPPVADFLGDPTSGTVPLTVDFTDQSTNSPTSWDWTFGDGGADTVQNPSHDYTSTGQFTVSLTAANAGGSDTETKTDYITVALPPVADFVGSPTSGPVPLTVDFTDLSTNSPTDWQWEFGDGGVSTDQHPTHNYVSPGMYTVTLTAANAGGSDTETKTDYIRLTVGPPAADFVGNPTSGPAPLTVYFTDLSTNDPPWWEWDFGDGGADTVQNPSHEYTSTGQYTVSLTAANAGGSDTETKTDYITVCTPAAADFSASPTSGTVPLTVDFTDLSTGDILAWEWDFGDGGADTVQNPSHEYLTPGIYTVSLTVTDACDSHTETKTDYITVGSASGADFSGSPTSGNAPLMVDFTDLSAGDILAWEWDFGDGGTSAEQNPSHEYTSTGQFTVSLTAANAGGQDTETKPDYITVGTPGAADFSAAPTGGNAPLMVDFTDLSTGPVLTWDWDFGDTGTSTDQNPSHEYLAPGTYTVSLTVTDAYDSHTEIKTDYITVGVAGVAAFSAAPTEGIMGMSVTFTDESTGDIDSWAWDFGDGGASTNQNPSHVYADPGIYNVSLTVTDPYDSYTETKNPYIWVGFLDCGPDDWTFEDTLLCVDAHIVQGYPGGYYQPTWAVNRGQMAVYIARAIAGGDSAVPDAVPPATFDDVSDTNSTWAWKYVEHAVAQNVVQGYDENTYAPEVEVDRGQMAVFIARGKGWVILGEDMTTAPELFPDVPAGFWAGTAIEACVDNAVVQGYLDGNYHPTDIVTRDQMSVYVARAFGLGP